MNDEIQSIQEAAQPLTGGSADYDAVIERCRNARIVLIGESTHGTHEFYSIRAEITKRLITDLGFHAVAVEADWPDSWRVNRFVRDLGDDKSAVDALGGFKRFPQWMWRNSDVLDFVGWLREHNESLSNNRSKVGFHGLDLYALRAFHGNRCREELRGGGRRCARRAASQKGLLPATGWGAGGG